MQRLVRTFRTVGLLSLMFSGAANAASEVDEMRLRDKFPMCKQFISVDWISRERKIGLAQYSLVSSTGERRQVDALVYLDKNYPKIDYGALANDIDPVTEWEKTNRSISILRAGDDGSIKVSEQQRQAMSSWDVGLNMSRGVALTFKKGNSFLRVYRNIWDVDESLAGNAEVVCLAYPEKDKVIVIEFPQADVVYNAEQLSSNYDGLLRALPKNEEKIWKSTFKESWVIDVNEDGVDDFPSLGIYSSGGKYRTFSSLLAEASDKKACEDLREDSFYITSNGNDYFINDVCSLKELTAHGAQ